MIHATAGSSVTVNMQKSDIILINGDYDRHELYMYI